jgi:hypothetical protein
VTARLTAALNLGERPGDAPAQARAVAASVNAHGGIAGRPMEVRLEPVDATGLRPYDRAFADACAALAAGTLQTVAVVAPPEAAPAQTGCLAAHGLTLVGDAPAVGDREVFSAAGDHLFAPGSMALDRLAAAYARILVRLGFLDRGSRVGVVRINEPMFERADHGALRPVLRDAGVRVLAEAAVRRLRGVADLPGAIAEVVPALLRFRLAAVDRVLILDAGVLTPLVMRAAEAQAYRPRYGLNSTMVPAALPGEVPADQLRGAVGGGFAPLLDVGGGDDAAGGGGTRQCEQIYRAAHLDAELETVRGRYAAVALCDSMLTVAAAVQRAADATADALPSALARLGDRRPSALALTSHLGPERHDGATSVRPLRFDDACRCVQYVGPDEVVP